MMATPTFKSKDIQALFDGKLVVVIGDSVLRSVYKDLVCLLKEDQLLTLDELKEKGEESFQGDSLLEGGVKTGLHNGTNYREVRKFTWNNDKTVVKFYFVTRCYNEYMQSILDEFKLNPPHVIIMNSCLWDLHRYGKKANDEYIANIANLIDAIDLAVPYEDRLFIWTATLPVREKVKAGFLEPGMNETLPAEDIRKANLYVRDQLKHSQNERFIFLDLHKVFYKNLHLRVKDGVHWNDYAHRKMTCLILHDIAVKWNYKLPPPQLPPPLPPSPIPILSKQPIPPLIPDLSSVDVCLLANTIPKTSKPYPNQRCGRRPHDRWPPPPPLHAIPPGHLHSRPVGLNTTFPPFPRKRKFMEEPRYDVNHNYKFPRKFK